MKYLLRILGIYKQEAQIEVPVEKPVEYIDTDVFNDIAQNIAKQRKLVAEQLDKFHEKEKAEMEKRLALL